jgi:hypothetical protein
MDNALLAILRNKRRIHVGAAAGCDPLILILKKQHQKIAACGSSYRVTAEIIEFYLLINPKNQLNKYILQRDTPVIRLASRPTNNKRGAYGRFRQAREFLRGGHGGS